MSILSVICDADRCICGGRDDVTSVTNANDGPDQSAKSPQIRTEIYNLHLSAMSSEMYII